MQVRTVRLLCAALFLFCLFLYTRDNTFPPYYHPDEFGKTKQLITGHRDFLHPQLILTATQAALAVLRVKAIPQKIVVVGRWVSAVCASLAVVFLTLLGARLGGPLGALGVGLPAALSPQLFELAHYMKEDTALLLGLALFFWALFRFWDERSDRSLLLLGFACGIALSGKYPGVVTLIAAIPLVALARSQDDASRARRRFFGFFGSLAATVFVINYPIVLHPLGQMRGMLHELQHIAVPYEGITRTVPHDAYWRMFRGETPPLVLLLIGAHLFSILRRPGAASAPLWILTAFPLFYGLVLSCSPLFVSRYFLPVSAFTFLLAGLGISELAQLVSESRAKRDRVLPTALGLALLAAVAGERIAPLRQAYQEFQQDSRAELIDWIQHHLPETAVIAADDWVHLPDPGSGRYRSSKTFLKQRILARKYAADLGAIDELREQGFTHVATTPSRYGKLFLRHRFVLEDYREDYLHRRCFYLELFERGELLFRRPAGRNDVVNLGLELYRLPEPGEANGGRQGGGQRPQHPECERRTPRR